jgi:ATP-binding protein involved in chromosome partitioning
LLAQIPLTPKLREGGDDGHPIAAVAPDSEAGRAFHQLAEKVEAMKPKKIFSKGLKLL